MMDANSTIQKLLKLRFELSKFGRILSIEPVMKGCGDVQSYEKECQRKQSCERNEFSR
jgi:hypothetical protein